MDIFQTAETRPASEFFELYQPGDAQEFYKGESLLMHSLSNKDLASRYELANFLLDKNCPLGGTGAEGDTTLHVLFGQIEHDVAQDAVLARRLIEHGADINALNKFNVLPFQWVLNMQFHDEDLAPIYDLWFEQPVLDFTTKNKWGYSPIDLAEKVPYRAGIAARMKEYVRDHSA